VREQIQDWGSLGSLLWRVDGELLPWWWWTIGMCFVWLEVTVVMMDLTRICSTEGWFDGLTEGLIDCRR